MKELRKVNSIKNMSYNGNKIGDGIAGLREYRISQFGDNERALFYRTGSLLAEDIKKLKASFIEKLSVITYLHMVKDIQELELVVSSLPHAITIERRLANIEATNKEIVMYDIDVTKSITNPRIEKILNGIKEQDLKIGLVRKSIEKDIVLCREVKRAGINYFVYRLSNNFGNYIIEETTLEKIIENSDNYINVKNNNESIVINGLDGEYEYSIEKVYEVYKRKEVNTKKSIKTSLLGVKHVEKVNLKGELVELYTEQSNIIIPQEAKRVIDKAIKLNTKNSEITFRDNLIRVDKNCFSVQDYNSKSNINKINIACNEEVAKQVLIAFNRVKVFEGVDVVFYRDITPYEMYYIAMSKVYRNINFAGNARLTQKVIKEAIDLMISKELDMRILNEPIKFVLEKRGSRLVGTSSKDFRDFKYKYNTIKQVASSLMGRADENLRMHIREFINHTDNDIKNREKELKKNIKIAKELIV